MKLPREDVIFLITYFFEELKGQWIVGSTIYSDHDLLQHFLNKIVGISTNGPKIQVINILRNENHHLIISEAKKLYPEWYKPESDEKILMLGRNLDRIKKVLNQPNNTQSVETIKKIETEKYEKKEKQIVGDPYTEQTFTSQDIEKWSKENGKRFRMTREQKERKMTREEAFTEFMQSQTIKQ